MASEGAAGQAFSDAAFAGDVAKLADLIKTTPVDSKDKDGFTALHRCAVTGNVAVVGFLLEHRANVNVVDAVREGGGGGMVQVLHSPRPPIPPSWQYGDTPLHYACFCGHLPVVKALVAAGGDPLRVSKDGKTAAQSAAEEGKMDVVAFLTSTVPAVSAVLAATSKPAAPSGAGPVAPPAPAAPIPAVPPAAGAGSSARYTAPGAPMAVANPAAAALAAAGGGKVTAAGGPSLAAAGLDFSKGVLMEGELYKKRANKVMKWRKKYYVLSATYGALFFWTGSRDRIGERRHGTVVGGRAGGLRRSFRAAVRLFCSWVCASAKPRIRRGCDQEDSL